MSGGKLIAAAWLTFTVLLATVALWSFSNMGDCPTAVTCVRAAWIDPLILVIAAAAWLGGIWLIIRRKRA